MVTKQSLKHLRKQVSDYNKRWTDSGKKLSTWKCVHCDKENETPKPTKSLVDSRGYWDSLSTCLHCGKFTFVKLWPNVKVKIVKVPGMYPEE